VAAIIAVLAILAGGFLWLRQSSLVAVQRVTVAGVSGPEASEIRSALRTAAQSMTTLDVQRGHLRAAVRGYPVVKALSVSTSFPHTLRIHVTEQVPVAVVQAAGRRIAVSGDGTLLPTVAASASLPTVAVTVAPGGTHVTGPARDDVALLAAAPYAMLAKVSGVAQQSGEGLVVTLRDGPRIAFGDGAQLGAKWSAATAVLASSSSAGADYIDVTDPARPAAGTGTDRASVPSTDPGTTVTTSGG
jgi:cell division protein FtsQ